MDINPIYDTRKINWHSDFKKYDLSSFQKKNKFDNWLELCGHNKLLTVNKKIIVDCNKLFQIILINLSLKNLKISHNNSIYNIKANSKFILNLSDNNKNKQVFKTNNNVKIHKTYLFNICFVLFDIDTFYKNMKNTKYLKKSVFHNDFGLLCGYTNIDMLLEPSPLSEYSLNHYIRQYNSEGNILADEELEKREWVTFLVEQWNRVNLFTKQKVNTHIPYKIHWVWLLGKNNESNPLRHKFLKFMNTWIYRNPYCEFNLWTTIDSNLPKDFKLLKNIRIRNNSDIEKLFLKTKNDGLSKSILANIKKLYKSHLNPGARSDILRQLILFREGGCYNDVNDACCLKNLQYLFDNYEFVIGIEPTMYVNNAIILAKKNYIVQLNILKYFSKNKDSILDNWNYAKNFESEFKDAIIVSTTGPFILTEIIFSIGHHNKNIFDKSIFLPSSHIYPNYRVWEVIGENTNNISYWIKPFSFTAHFDQRDFLEA